MNVQDADNVATAMRVSSAGDGINRRWILSKRVSAGAPSLFLLHGRAGSRDAAVGAPRGREPSGTRRFTPSRAP